MYASFEDFDRMKEWARKNKIINKADIFIAIFKKQSAENDFHTARTVLKLFAIQRTLWTRPIFKNWQPISDHTSENARWCSLYWPNNAYIDYVKVLKWFLAAASTTASDTVSSKWWLMQCQNTCVHLSNKWAVTPDVSSSQHWRYHSQKRSSIDLEAVMWILLKVDSAKVIAFVTPSINWFASSTRSRQKTELDHQFQIQPSSA